MADCQESVFELRCTSQNYHWGKQGSDSMVAKLLDSADSTFKVDAETRYAELWMGTHPSGPSTIVRPGQPDKSLAQWITENPDKLGENVNKMYNGSLPYLFKVLSVDKALSIQAHPNKLHAEELHTRDPKNYKDSNHKPEMAIALTKFTGLCGFRPIAEVAKFVKDIAEFEAVIKPENGALLTAAAASSDVGLQEEAMRSAFSCLMLREKNVVKKHLQMLVNKVRAMGGQDTSMYVGDILLKLDDEFPGDAGAFAIYFLNVMRINVGDAMFLEANLPHAYLSGDCMECMACSDNVVRAGLTPKFIDTETLVAMLNYQGRSAGDNIFQPEVTTENGCRIQKFLPPIKDFAVTQINVPGSSKTCILQALSSASINICIEGCGIINHKSLSQPITVHRGKILFIAANKEVTLESTSTNDILLFRAHAGC